jgi:hypothetical protein
MKNSPPSNRNCSIDIYFMVCLRPTFHARLPIGNNNSSLINVSVHIQDKFYCITEYKISSVYVFDDSKEIDNLFKSFKESKTDLTNNSFVNGLLTENQNDIGQILTSVSQQSNKINNDSLNNVVPRKK